MALGWLWIGGWGLGGGGPAAVAVSGGASGEACLFGEGPGGFVVAGEAAKLRGLAAEGVGLGIDMLPIGEAAGDRIDISAAEAELSVSLRAAEQAWRSLSPS